MADEPDGEKKPLVAVFGKFGVCRSEQLIKITVPEISGCI